MAMPPLSSSKAEERKTALDHLAEAPAEAVSHLDELLGLLDDPLAGCDDLGALAKGKEEPIGRTVALRAMNRSLGGALAAAARSDEDALHRICLRGGDLQDRSIRTIYDMGGDLMRSWLCAQLVEEDSAHRQQASKLLAAVTMDYKGRLALKTGPLASFLQGPVKRPPLLDALSEKGLDVLTTVLRDEEEWLIRTRVASALGCLEPTEPLVTSLVAALSDEHERVRECAATSLELIGEKAAPAVPALVEALKSAVDLAAARALGAIGPAAKEAVPALKAWKKRGDGAAKEEAKRAIARIEGKA